MPRLLLLLTLLSATACTTPQRDGAKQAWTVGWCALRTPVQAACTPVFAAWDLAFLGPKRFRRRGLTCSMWREWREGVLGRSKSWVSPLVLPALPLAVLLEPLPLYLWLSCQAYGG
jgi:hypothetical protein